MNFIAEHPFLLGKGCSVCRKILRSRIFLFLCIRLNVIGKEDRAEETHQGCVFVQVSLAENEVFRQADPFPLGKGCFFAYGEPFRRQKIPPRRENACNLYDREAYMQVAKIKAAKSI